MTERSENSVQNQQWRLSLGESSTLITPGGVEIPLSEKEGIQLKNALEVIQRQKDSEPGVIRELRASGFKFGCVREGGCYPEDRSPI